MGLMDQFTFNIHMVKSAALADEDCFAHFSDCVLRLHDNRDDVNDYFPIIGIISPFCYNLYFANVAGKLYRLFRPSTWSPCYLARPRHPVDQKILRRRDSRMDWGSA